MASAKTLTSDTSSRLIFVYAALALFVPMLMQFYLPAAGGLDIMGHPLGRDFINVWAGPKLAFSGHIATLFEQQAYHDALTALFGQPMRFHTWSYPPSALPLLLPFSVLPYFASLALWTVSLLAVYAAVALAPVAAPNRRLALLLLVLSPAALINIIGGQNGFATAALFMGGILLLDKRPVTAGILFGILTIKPQLGLVLPFVLLALGAWRTIAAAVLTALALMLLSVLVLGTDSWSGFLGPLRDNQIAALEEFKGFYTYMTVSVYAAARMLGMPLTPAMILQGLVTVPVLMLAVWAARRTSDPRQRAFVLAAAAALVTPYAFNYDLTALTMAIVWKLTDSRPLRRSDMAILFAAYIAPLAGMYGNMVGAALTPLALLAVFAIAVRDTGPVRQYAPQYP
ncbi:glycosyltransferase family 87 protein [soil metagenome]